MSKKKATMGIVRIPCDGLATQEKGWVEISAYLKVKHLPYVEALRESGFDKAATAREKEEALGPTYDLLSVLVEDWNWKAPDGSPYPKPYKNPEVFADLRPAEYDWIREKALWVNILNLASRWGIPPSQVMEEPLIWAVRQAEYDGLREKINRARS